MRTFLILVAVVALAACGGEDRPGVDSWADSWDRTRDLVPTAAELERDAAERCGHFLGEVRAQREELLPAPTEAVEQAFTDWVNEAESLGLDCTDDTEDLDARLAELAETADRVDQIVANQAGGGS